MPDTIKISELDEALALADAAEFPYSQENGGERTTFKAPLTQIAAKIVEDMSYAGINLPSGAGVKSVENTLNYLLGAVGGNPNGNISDSYDPTAAYVKGDLCIYENVLYICTAPTTGTFDPSKWTATTIDNVIGDLSQLTTSVTSSLVGAVNEVNAKESYKVRVSQLALPNTITLSANTATMVLNNSDVKSLTYSALDDISNITGTLVGVVFMWCSGGGAICLDNLVWEGKCTMYLMSTYTKDISAIRLMTIWKQ